ncbi:prepilin-type N-terminal cleavage/methylation domain-containing protein [Actinoplanes sp. NPDC024001]|uniref:prepilin-type N-terminal cleavage/methylation domain-containing protein n=1 Tax=Actinoplanes sp. NPDC024001 TaxID=3154598 RepID=UPI00340F1C40
MQDAINRLRNKKDDEGFTLIELLVVVVIIGVLVAIAVPVYLNYRKGAADKSAQSDVRGAISAIEQFYTSNSNTYPDSAKSADDKGAALKLTSTDVTTPQEGTITVSDGTLLGYKFDKAKGTYLVCARNTGGTDSKAFIYDSAAGGSVGEKTGTLNVETCVVS